MEKVGLVLEGGGMRGLYTAGVLEYFAEKGLFFPYVIGVSAGACMAASYLSRQKGRNKKVNIDLVSDHRFLSFRNFVKKRELFGMDFLFDEIPNKVVPFDYNTFLSTPEQFVVAATDCNLGAPVYYNKNDHGKDMLTIMRASSSLPFIAPLVEYDSKRLLDGGLIDPIPIKKSEKDGYAKNVVILTKPKGYLKRGTQLSFLSKTMYKAYPKIDELLQERHDIYNKTIAYIDRQQENGNVFLIQPSKNLPVKRIERNQKRLKDLYKLGYQDAAKIYDSLIEFCKQQRLVSQ
jgi:predicted patatin/cPLA2 family phospholipase